MLIALLICCCCHMLLQRHALALRHYYAITALIDADTPLLRPFTPTYSHHYAIAMLLY